MPNNRIVRFGNRAAHSERGNALVELALVTPVLAAILLASMDAGIYMFSFISVQNAARSAAIRNSGGRDSAADQTNACAIALDNLRGLPGIAGAANCSGAPVQVTSQLCESQSACGSATSSADSEPASLVTVSYTPPSIFRIPLSGPATIRATAQMKLRNRE